MAIGGVSSPLDSFEVTESSQLRIKFSAEKPAHRQSAKRYGQVLKKNINQATMEKYKDKTYYDKLSEKHKFNERLENLSMKVLHKFYDENKNNENVFSKDEVVHLLRKESILLALFPTIWQNKKFEVRQDVIFGLKSGIIFNSKSNIYFLTGTGFEDCWVEWDIWKNDNPLKFKGNEISGQYGYKKISTKSDINLIQKLFNDLQSAKIELN